RRSGSPPMPSHRPPRPSPPLRRTRPDRPRRRRPPALRPEPPRCRHFGVCGGCSHLDVPIDVQLRDKVAAGEALPAPFLGRRRVEHAWPSATPVHFRTKLLYPVRRGRDGRPELGIYEPRSHDLVRVRECRTQDEGLTALGVAAERILQEHGLLPWDEATGRGFVRAFHARLCAGTGELLLGVVTRPGVFPGAAALADSLLAAAQDLPRAGAQPTVPVGVVRSISDRDGNFLLGD